MKKHLPAILILCLVNLAWVIRWHFLDRGTPRFDGSWHLLQSWNDYLSVGENGFWSYFKNSITHRSNYFLGPTVVSWLLILTRGEWRVSIGFFMSLCYAVGCFYLYLDLRERLNTWLAIGGTLLMMLSTVALDMSAQFENYIPFLSFGMAAAYHLKKSDYWKSKKHSLLFGLFLILSFGMRPFECSVLFLIPIVFVSLQGLDKKKVNSTEVGGVFILSFLAALCAALNSRLQLWQDWQQSLGFVFLLGFFFIYLAAKRKLTNYSLSLLPFLLWVGLWFLSTSSSLIHFAYDFSFNPWLNEINGSEKVGIFSTPKYLFVEYGKWPLSILLLLIAANGVERLIRHKFVIKFSFRDLISLESGFILGAFLFLAIGFSSNTSEPYYYLGPVFVLGVSALSFLLGNSGQNISMAARFNQGVIYTLVFIQVVFQWGLDGGTLKGWSPHTVVPVTSAASMMLIGEAAAYFSNDRDLQIGVLTQRPTYDDSDPPLVNLPGILLSIRLTNPKWSGFFEIPSLPNSSQADLLYRFTQASDFILVGPVDGRPQPRRRDLKLLPSLLVNMIQNSKLSLLHLSLVNYFNITDELGHSVRYALLEKLK